MRQTPLVMRGQFRKENDWMIKYKQTIFLELERYPEKCDEFT